MTWTGRRPATLVFVALAACGRGTGPGDDLHVTITSSAAVIEPGRTIAVDVTATNRGPDAVTISANTCPDAFVVTSRAGAVVGPDGKLCAAAARSAKLAPGESFVLRHIWSGDGGAWRPGAPPSRLPPGEYLLRGRVLGAGVLAESRPIVVTVR